MAQTIKIKNSGTSGNTPSSLVHGELAINYADGKIFYKNSGNSIVEFSASGSFLPLSGGTLTGTLNTKTINLQNHQIYAVNNLRFNDPGVNEGIKWDGGNEWQIYESPDDQSNASGNLQFTSGSGGGTRRATLDTSGNWNLVNGGLQIGGNTVITSGRALQQITSLAVDNITIDGTEIDCNTNLFVDVAGDITLDADGGDILLNDGGTEFGRFVHHSAGLIIRASESDQDLFIQGTDGGSTINALTFDMSDAGAATFNGNVKVPDGAASAPAITFSNDSDTGMYRFTDTLAFTVNGQRKAYVTAAGIFSDNNVYVVNGGQFRTFAQWTASTGGAGSGFTFTNTQDSTTPLTISSTGNAVFAGEVEASSLDINGAVDIDGNTVITGSSGTGFALEVERGDNSADVLLAYNNGVVQTPNNYLYASYSGGASFYSEKEAVFRNGILNDQGDLEVKDTLDITTSGTLKIAGTTVITSARALQNVSGNISMFNNDSGYLTSHQSLSGLLPLSGGTMTGPINMGSQNLSGINNATAVSFLSTNGYWSGGTQRINGNGDLVNIGSITTSSTISAGSTIHRGNLTIDSQEIDVSNGDLTLDVQGNLILDADGGTIDLMDGGTRFGRLQQMIGGLGISAGSTPTFQQLLSSTKTLFFGHIELGDSKHVRWGNGNGDLQIFHDGSNSYIEEYGTGDLIISSSVLRPRTDSFILNNAANTEHLIIATADGAVDLYHNGVKKLNTKSDGVDITGELQSDSLDVDGNADISGTLTVHTGGSSIKSPLYMGVQNSTGEGGEIVLSGSNSNTGHTLDTVNGSFRIFDNNGTLLSGNSGYGLSVVNGYRVNGTQVITSSRGARNLTLEHGTGGARFEVGDWMYSTDNNNRFYFESGARTFYKATTHQFRNTNSSTVFNISSQGHLHIASGGDSNASSTEYIKAGGVAILTNARVLQNVSGNISMFTNDAGYITGGNFVATNADSTVATNKKIQFRDANNFINSHAGSELGVNAEESLHLNAASEVLVGGTSGTAQIQLKSEDIQLKDFTLSGSTVPYADVTQNVTNTASGLQDQTLSGSGSGASNLGSLGIDQGGRIVRHEQEQTFRFSRAQMLASFGGNGITLIPAVGNDKAMIITEMVTMIEFTSAITGGAGTSNPLVVTGGGSSSTMFELRSVPGSFATGVIGAIPRTAFAQATQTTTSGSAPHYGFIYRDLPSGTSSAQKIMCSNNDLKIHKIGTISQMGTGVTAMYIKVRYKIFNGSTF